MSKTIVDVIEEIGADNLLYQKLSNNMTQYNYKPRSNMGEVTFVTDPSNVDQGKEALILWIDKEVLSSAFDKIKSDNG